MILPLSAAHDQAIYGNKAANLARIMGAGLSSRDGFVVQAQVLQDNLVRLGMQDRFAALGQAGSDRKDVGEALRTAIRTGGVSDALRGEVASALEPERVYAVRSSAVGEDGTAASFAGQFDSILGCSTAAQVCDAICQVWSSLLNPRALAYADRKGNMLDRMAVVIQEQVAAVASGVLFTVDPRAPQNGHMIVEYCDGLGEQLVSGQITPAAGQIDRTDGSYNHERDADTDATWSPRLKGAASGLRDLGLALERAFGCAQDIEFSINADGQIVVLQSRPITTSGPAADTEMVSWSNANIAENFPDPVCRMLQSFVARGYGAYFRSLALAFGVPRSRVAGLGERFDEVVACHGGRLYYNLSNIHLLLYAVPGGRRLAEYFNTFTGAEGLEPPPDARRPMLREALELARMPLQILCQYCLLSRRLRGFEDRVDAYARASTPNGLAAKTPEELARLVEGFLDIRLNHWTPAALSDAAAMISYGLLGSLLRDTPETDENTLLQGLPGLASARPVEALWALSEDLKGSEAADLIRRDTPEDVLTLLQSGALQDAGRKIWAYLETWGFRSSGELLLIRPTPWEDPISVLRLLRAYLLSDDAGPMEKSLRQAGIRQEKTRAAIGAMRIWPRQRFRAVLWATQKSIGLRERARMKQALLYSRLRQVALAAGQRLTDQGRLSQPEDVFHLGVDELASLLRGGTLAGGTVAARAQEMADDQSWSPPAVFTLAKGQMFRRQDAVIAPAQDRDASNLRGTSACGGQTDGTAAVVLDVSEIGTIQKDQILVTRQTDPGWATVFFLVKGLVIERGGLLSHGAIIAREYGIPAVIGVQGATTAIKSGDRVEILADTGEVRIHAQ